MKTIAICIGSGAVEKNWAYQKWEALVGRLFVETKHWFFLICGPNEWQDTFKLAQSIPNLLRAMVAANLPINLVAATMKKCDFYIGNDSQISQVASAAGIPGIVLWDKKSGDIWQPEGLEVLRGDDGVNSISVDDVFKLVVSKLA